MNNENKNANYEKPEVTFVLFSSKPDFLIGSGGEKHEQDNFNSEFGSSF